jgi:hypothetical protein
MLKSTTKYLSKGCNTIHMNLKHNVKNNNTRNNDVLLMNPLSLSSCIVISKLECIVMAFHCVYIMNLHMNMYMYIAKGGLI